MKDKPIWQWSAREVARACASGVVSARAVTQANLDRIAERNPALNAIVQETGDEALAEAEALDKRFRSDGPAGPLHGVPVTIKVNVDQRGYATTNGVEALKDFVASDNAPLVDNVKKAGAIVVGRTNTPEFSFRASTDNPLHGRTFNAWNDWASAGGSSGGAGAAVMAGMGALAHGNDIGGSLRYPATANGAATVKPGQGRVPAWNPSQPAERGLLAQLTSVQGFIARTVDDVRLGMEVMVQGDPRDPWHVPLPLHDPFGEGMDEKPKVAFTKETHDYPLAPEVSDALDAARAALEEAGYAVEDVDIPNIRETARLALGALFGEVKALMDADLRRLGSPDINKVFDVYYASLAPLEGTDLLRAFAERTGHLRRWNLFLQEYPLVLTPFMPFPTWAWDFDLTDPEGPRALLEGGMYSVSMNFLGLPAGNVPASYNDGLPIGVQVIGRRFREDQILDALEAIESRVGVMAERLFERD